MHVVYNDNKCWTTAHALRVKRQGRFVEGLMFKIWLRLFQRTKEINKEKKES